MAATVTYAPIDGELVYENRGEVETYYVPDTQGSLIECHDATGAITYEAWYWPYGEIRSVSGSKANSWGYIGLLGYLADTSQSLYVRARYNRPDLTRWQTADPVWPYEPPYGYCRMRPTLFVNPSGYQLIDPIVEFPTDLDPVDPFDDPEPMPVPKPKPIPGPIQPVPFPWSLCNPDQLQEYCTELREIYKRDRGGGTYGERPRKYKPGRPISNQDWNKSCDCCEGRPAFFNAGCDPEDDHKQAREGACDICSSWNRIFYGPRPPYEWPAPPWVF